MNRFFLALILLLPLQAIALELKVGDILLQPLNCWSCRLIEEQENTIYSHMGMIIETSPELKVVEALGSVRTINLKEFSVRTEKGQRLSVRRFQNDQAVAYLQNNQKELVKIFQDEFLGMKYDHDFLWNNVDENGVEKLYCSEMVSKLLHRFMQVDLPIKKMKFDKNREYWIQYFHGNPPDGMWGNAPADFEKSSLFYEVGEL
jgi:hypothetical protein